MKLKDANIHYFFWRGRTHTGNNVHDKIYALSKQDVIDQLTRKKIRISQIKQITPPLFFGKKTHITTKDIDLITRQLATMLNAGLPLTAALTLITKNQTKTANQLIVRSIRNSIEEGTSLSTALKRRRPLFDEIYIHLVTYAELTGQLAQTFERIALYREKNAQQKSKLIKAMLYPFFVMILAFSTSYLMLANIIPEFEKMFSSVNTPLPKFTQQVISFSRWLSNNTGNMLLCFFVITTLFKIMLMKSDKARLIVDQKIINTPIIGQLISKSIIARFSRTLAVAVRSGVPIISALQNSANLTNNNYYKLAFTQLFNTTSTGVPIYIAMKKIDGFPDLMVQMIMVGEESGTLDKMLDKIADTFDTELDQTMDKMAVLIEPFLILFLGVVIGGLVIAIYLPIFNMMNVLG